MNINKTNNLLSPQISECKKTTTYGVGNTSPWWRQAHIYRGVKPVDGNPVVPFLIIGHQTLLQKYRSKT